MPVRLGGLSVRRLCISALCQTAPASKTPAAAAPEKWPVVTIDHFAVNVSEDFVLQEPAVMGRQGGFELGWQPDRILAVVPNSYPKRYMVKWEGSRVVEAVDTAVLREKAPKMLVSFLESHV